MIATINKFVQGDERRRVDIELIQIRFYTGKYIREADSFYDAYTWGVNTTGGIWCS